MITYLSVCSGIEAATAAWHPLGWSPFAFAEIEAFPSAVLSHHYGSNLIGEPLSHNAPPNLGDMNGFKDWPDAAIDVLVGGTPCQSFSVAGLRKGLADPRGNLAVVYLAIADRYRPEWIIWENVPGVLSSEGGRDFGAIVGGMVELGYCPAWRVLDAQYVRVDGFGRAVPQRRRRVFVVGHLGDWRRAAAVLFERESLQGHSAPRRQAGEGIAPTISARPTGGGGLGTDFDCDGGLIAGTLGRRSADHPSGLKSESEFVVAVPDISHCLNAGGMGRQDYETDTVIAHALRADGFDASEDGTGRGTPIVPVDITNGILGDGVAGTLEHAQHKSNRGLGVLAFDTTQITSKTNRCQPQPGGPCHPLAAGAHAPAIAQPVADTITAHWERSKGAKAGNQVGLLNPIITPGWAVRRLTPLECERLQGFPDGYTAVPFRGKPAADGPRYKALGNSMAVNCMRWLGWRIELVSSLTTTQGKEP
ncbi:MAG TPA: DNA cytosine methyltransferase [Pseudolabrys sp.]|nr:DNA cytosine methyltransferase [Pseudolabrys sp.]